MNEISQRTYGEHGLKAKGILAALEKFDSHIGIDLQLNHHHLSYWQDMFDYWILAYIG